MHIQTKPPQVEGIFVSIVGKAVAHSDEARLSFFFFYCYLTIAISKFETISRTVSLSLRLSLWLVLRYQVSSSLPGVLDLWDAYRENLH